MEGRTRGVLDGALDWICRPFGLTVVPVSAASRASAGQGHESALVPSHKDDPLGRDFTPPEARIYQYSAEPVNVLAPISKFHVGKAQSEVIEEYEQKGESNLHRQLVQYTDGPDRAINVDDGAKECIALLLTEETISHLVEIARKRKHAEKVSCAYQKASQRAAVSQGFLDYFNTMLEDATSQEELDQLTRELEQRKPDVLRDIKRKEHLQNELLLHNQDLTYTRGLAEDTIEQILLEAQLLSEIHEEDAEEPGDEDTDIGTPVIHDTTIDMAQSEQPPGAIENGLEVSDPREELELARQKVFEMQDNFDREPWLQERKIIEYRQMQRQGVVSFPESELDLDHVRRRAETTRALIEAEEAFEQARARARALGVLYNDFDQESGFVDCTDDGFSDYGDPDTDMLAPDPAPIVAWASKVAESQEQLHAEPDIDEWDSRSISLSECISVVADGKGRSRIDRWQYVEESIRDGAFGGDAGAMGLAILSGELQLFKK